MTANFSSKRNSCPIIKLQPCGPCGSAKQLRRASPPGPGLTGGYFTVEVKAIAPCELEAGVGKTFTQVPWGFAGQGPQSPAGLRSSPFPPACRPRTRCRKRCLGCVSGILFYGVKNHGSQLFLLLSALMTSPPSSPRLKTNADLS